MDSSRAWLTIVTDSNDEGDDEYNDNEDDDDGVRADHGPTRSHSDV